MENKKIIIWGANTYKGCFIEYLIKHYYDQVIFLVDSDPEKQGREIFGKTVFSPEYITNYANDSVKIVVTSVRCFDEIAKQAKQLGHNNVISAVHDMKNDYLNFCFEQHIMDGYIKVEGLSEKSEKIDIASNIDKLRFLPTILAINFTEECNLRCIWCYFHGIMGKKVNSCNNTTAPCYISDKMLSRIVSSVREIDSLNTLSYAGAGELFMDKHWFEHIGFVLRSLPQIKKLNISTNGMLLNENNIQKLVSLDFQDIDLNLSVDGLSMEDTEKYRLKSKYSVIKQNIHTLLTLSDNRFHIWLGNTHPLKKNEPQDKPFLPQYLLDDFPDIGCSANIARVPLQRQNIGDGDGSEEKPHIFKQAECFMEYGLEPVVYYRKEAPRICFYPFNLLYFDYLGHIRLCGCGQFGDQEIIGTVDQDCLHVWQNSEISQSTRQKFLKFETSPYCGICPFQNIDRVYRLKEREL